MVSIALPTLSTKNIGKAKLFQVVDSGTTMFPNDTVASTYLDVISDNKKFRFVLNWTNQTKLGELGYVDTEDLHGKTLTISVEDTKFKNKDVEGLRIQAVD